MLKVNCRRISRRLANATRIFAIPAARMFVRMPFVTGTMCGTPSMSCTNYCRQNSPARNKPSCSMSMVVLPRWISSDLSTARSSRKARLQPMTSVARRWKSGGRRGQLTRVLCCTRRHGSRRHQKLGVRVFDVLRDDSHRRIDNSPTRAESHVGVDFATA
jgi:hypothetical protein